QRDRLAPDGAQGHGQQRGGDHLAGADQLVHLPRRRVVVELMGEGDELVGGVAHGADHHDHAVAEPACALDPLGHPADALGGGDAAAPVLLDDVVHNAGGYASRSTRAPKLRTRLTTVRPRSPQRFAAAISASWTASGRRSVSAMTDGPAPAIAAPRAPPSRAAAIRSGSAAKSAERAGWCQRSCMAAPRLS